VNWPTNPAQGLDWVQLLLAGGAALTGAELLALRREYRPEGFLGWPMAARLVSRRRFPWPGRWMGAGMRERGVLVVAGIRLAAALGLLAATWAASPTAAAPLLAVVLVTGLLLMQRLPYGMEGSDQLAAITGIALLVARLFPGSARMAAAVAWFIALQAALAYLTAGVVKLRNAGWRDGTLLQGVLGTEFYGHRVLAGWLARPAAARAAIWGVILFELSFPLVFVLPAPLVAVWLAAGLLFHLTLAVTMGLNAFVWAFAAAYPAIWSCAAR